MKAYGFIPSLITKDTVRFNAPKSISIPKKYTYRPFLSPITNQGTQPFCVPHSIGNWLNWRESLKTGKKIDNNIKYSDIYYSKKTECGEGMTFNDAFNYLKKKGVKSNVGVLKISQFGLIPNVSLLKPAILANGPCFGALPVFDSDSPTFWKRTRPTIEGWHAITIVGWNEEGYIIRNSWGIGFADRGYVVLPYSDASSFRELWTILG